MIKKQGLRNSSQKLHNALIWECFVFLQYQSYFVVDNSDDDDDDEDYADDDYED